MKRIILTKFNCRRGSLSLEAAIIIPVFCAFVLFLVSILQYYALYVVTANACISSAEKLSGDVSIFYNLGLDSLDARVRTKAVELLPEDGISGQIAAVLAGKAIDSVESAAFEAVMKTAVENELQKEIERSGIPIEAHVISLIGSSFLENGGEMKLCVRTGSDYLFPNFVTGNKGVKVDYSLSFDGWLYGGCPRYKVSDINVWELHNFERGRVLEELYGGNLPDKFPVIDIFDKKTGECFMIVSVDTTAPTYRSYENLRKLVSENADRLSSFKGGDCDGVKITEAQIRSKKIILVIPDNEALTRMKDIVNTVISCSMSYNVNIEVSIYQHSYAYENSRG